MSQKNNYEQVFQELLKPKNRLARIRACQESHELFFYIHFHAHCTHPIAPFHERIFAMTENPDLKLAVIMAFRSSAKSTIVATSFPIWAVLGKLKKKYVLIICQTQTKAQLAVRNIKSELETNRVLQKDLGPFTEDNDNLGTTSLNLGRYGARITISSIDTSIRGTKFKQHRPDLIILDDIEDSASVKTQEGRNKVYEWFNKEIVPVGDEQTQIFLLGNLLHRDALLNRLIAKIESGELAGESLVVPIVDQDGNPTWPGKYPSRDHIEAKRKTIPDQRAWCTEFLLVIPPDDQLIKEKWIQYYDKLPAEKPRGVFISIDPAISQKNSADYTAMIPAYVYGYEKNLKVYILDGIVNEKLTTNESTEKTKALYDRIKQGIYRSKIFVEDVAFQGMLADQLKRSNYPAEGVKIGSQDKYARLASVTQLFETGKIFFPRNEKARILVNQLLGFQVEKHDDLVDALSMLLHQVITKHSKFKIPPFNFKGPYNGEFDHLPPDERQYMLNVRQSMRDLELL